MAPVPDSSNLDSLRREPWAAHARHWNRLGPPLRPSPQDLERIHGAWVQSLSGRMPERRIEILSLGVTPEIAQFTWAEDFFLTAVDASETMIHAVWPGDGPRCTAVHGDWLAMPFDGGSFDLVVSDCGLAPLSAPEQLTTLNRELRRVLRPDGRAVLRHLTRPAQSEPLEAVVKAVTDGHIAGFHELKLRLLLALPADPRGVCLAHAWECFQRLFPDRPELAVRLGCSLETISTIDAYRDREARYVFPDLNELAQVFSGFSLMTGPAGHYPLAECCPVFALIPRS